MFSDTSQSEYKCPTLDSKYSSGIIVCLSYRKDPVFIAEIERALHDLVEATKEVGHKICTSVNECF